MIHWYAVVILVSAFALSESIQAEPRCSQLGKYALRPDLKNQLALDVIVYEPKKDVSVSLEYLCALEGMAGLILENPHKAVNCPADLGIFPLYFEWYGEQKRPDITARDAVGQWAQHIPRLTFASGFGCNHVYEHGLHKFLCIFK